MANLTGPASNQIPSAKDFGSAAWQNVESFVLLPGSAQTPALPGEMLFQRTSDTVITIKLRGLDGIVRTGTITLA